MASGLNGRVAVVTGASGAIGRAVALRLAADGAKVAAVYGRGRERADALVAEMRRRGAHGLAVRADVSDPADVKAMGRRVEETLGTPDILVNGAGVSLYKLAVDTEPSEWQRTLDVNLSAAFWCSTTFLPGMIRQGWGRIVNIGSIWGEVGAAGEAAYAAAKAGLAGLTRSLAKEAARTGVTVNGIAPGVIDTPMNAGFDEEERLALLGRIPLGRLGTGEDIAGAVAFFASDDAGYVTGHTLWVTGGFDPIP